MYSFLLRKILYQTIHVQNFHEDNREHIHLLSEKFSIKQDICKILKNIIESVFNCFWGKFSMKQYVSKILKKIIEIVFICFMKDSLSKNRYQKFFICIQLSSENFSTIQYLSKILKNIIENVFICFP